MWNWDLPLNTQEHMYVELGPSIEHTAPLSLHPSTSLVAFSMKINSSPKSSPAESLLARSVTPGSFLGGERLTRPDEDQPLIYLGEEFLQPHSPGR